MKKIFILVFATGTFIAAAAQHGGKINNTFDVQQREKNHYSNDYAPAGIAGGKETAAYGNYPYSFKQRAAELNRINREFDQKAAFTSSNRHLRYGEKARQLRTLENQRRMAIREAQGRFEKSRARSGAAGADKQHERH